MGVSFGIDFSGSTNFVILPPAVVPASASQTSASGGSANSAATLAGGQHSTKPRTAAVSATGTDDGAEKEGGRSDCGGDGTHRKLRDEEVASKRTPTVGGMLGEECNMSEGSGMSARVSTGAFRRALVARVTVRDPSVKGILKVESPSRYLVSVVP